MHRHYQPLTPEQRADKKLEFDRRSSQLQRRVQEVSASCSQHVLPVHREPRCAKVMRDGDVPRTS